MRHGPAQTASAGCVYMLIVFAAGFVLGTIRTLVLIPAIGKFAAVAVEMPFMLAASWLVCGMALRWFAVRSLAERAVMGGTAFVLLMLAEVALARLIFGQALADYLAGFADPAALLGLAGQAVFALFPLVRSRFGWPVRGSPVRGSPARR